MNAKRFVPELCPISLLIRRISAILVVLMILLASCANESLSTPTRTIEESVLIGVQTAVAATRTVGAAIIPTLTPSPIPSSTSTATTTSTPVTPSITAQIVYVPYYYWQCEDSDFVRDVTIPDGTILIPGEAFVKTWRFRNVGSCTWDHDYQIVFLHGKRMHGSDTEIGETVRVDGRVDASVEMIAPSQPGTYSAHWQLADLNGNTFGDVVYVEIVVAIPTATITPSPTLTNTASLTLTASLTSTPETPTLTLTASPVTPSLTNTVEPPPTLTETAITPSPTSAEAITPSPTEDDPHETRTSKPHH